MVLLKVDLTSPDGKEWLPVRPDGKNYWEWKVQSNMHLASGLQLRFHWNQVWEPANPTINPLCALCKIPGRLSRLSSVWLEICSSKNEIVVQSASHLIRVVFRHFRGKIVALAMDDVIFQRIDPFLDVLKKEPCLESLTLRKFTPLPENGAEEFPKLFHTVAELPKIKWFELHKWENLFPVSRRPEPLIPALRALAQCATLRRLELHGFEFFRRHQFSRPFFDSLQSPSLSLRHLKIASYPMDGTSFYFLVRKILTAHTSSLRTLSLPLPANSKQHTIIPVAKALIHNVWLGQLFFEKRGVGDDPLFLDDRVKAAFEDALQDKNQTLQELYFQDINMCSTQSIRTIVVPRLEFYLKLNRVGRRWLLMDSKQDTSVEDWEDMIERNRNDLDMVYYFLRKRPDVLLINTRKYTPPSKRRRLFY